MIPDTSKLNVMQDFNRLKKVNFNWRKEKASENLATKKLVENTI